MTETTQSERERLLDMPVDNIVHSLCRDADRLAKLEDGIRALEKKYGEYSPADRVSSIHFYRELRALWTEVK